VFGDIFILLRCTFLLLIKLNLLESDDLSVTELKRKIERNRERKRQKKREGERMPDIIYNIQYQIAAEIEESRERCKDNHFRVVTVLRNYFRRAQFLPLFRKS